jgi:hypothetical protein
MDVNLTVDIITKLIGNLGFPIFVAAYMMIKSSKETEALTDAINTLSNKIDNILAGVNNEHE